MNKGDVMHCDLLRNGKPTGEVQKVRVLEIRRDHMTQEPQSIRVKPLNRAAIWVQPQYLHEVKA